MAELADGGSAQWLAAELEAEEAHGGGRPSSGRRTEEARGGRREEEIRREREKGRDKEKRRKKIKKLTNEFHLSVAHPTFLCL